MSRLVPAALVGAVLAAVIAADQAGRTDGPDPTTPPAVVTTSTTVATTPVSTTRPTAAAATVPSTAPPTTAPAPARPGTIDRTFPYGFPADVPNPGCAVTSWFRDSVPSWWLDCVAATPSDLVAYAERFTDTERRAGPDDTTGTRLSVVRPPWQITAAVDDRGLHVTVTAIGPVGPAVGAVDGPLADLPDDIPRPVVPLSQSETSSGPDGRRRWTLQHRDAGPDDYDAYVRTLTASDTATDLSAGPDARYVSATRAGHEVEVLWTPTDGLVVTVR